MVARHGTPVEDLVRSYRRAQRNEEMASTNEARLPAESGALVLKALEAALDEINERAFAENVPAGTSLSSPSA